MNKITKVINRNKSEKDITNKEDIEIYNSSSSHDYIYFICEKCNNEGSRVKSKFIFNDFICKKCKLSSVDRTSYKKQERDSKFYSDISNMRTEEHHKKAKETRTKTLNEKYGVNNVMELPDIKNKISSVFKERYGVDNALQLKQTRDGSRVYKHKKAIERIEKLFEVKRLFNIEDFSLRMDGRDFRWLCLKFNNIFEDDYYYSKLFPKCPSFYPKSKNFSASEHLLTEFLSGKKIKDDKYEIDCFLEEHNIGFEFNGLYWHSSKFVDKNYHLNKTNHFSKKGIRIFHIFEDEWEYKEEIVKSVLNSKIGRFETEIFARKTEIRIVNPKDAEIFQEQNHIQGSASSSVNIGLYYNNELISLMTFGKSRFSKKYEWELVRFVNKKNTKIIGGASKIFKYFINTHNPSGIVSYSDTRLFDGGLYETLGFHFSHKTPPQYYYVKNGRRFNRMSFQKKLLKDKLKIFDENLTEEQNMLNNGFYRIYDCGQVVWVWE